MGLVERLLRLLLGAGKTGRFTLGLLPALDLAKKLFCRFGEFFMVDIAGGGHDNARGPIIPVAPGQHLFAVHGGDQFRGAEDGAAQGMVAIAGALGEIKNQVIGLVIGGGDFLQDDVALALQLIAIKGGFGENVGEDIEGQGPVILQHAGIIGGGFHAGRGVDFTACRFNLLGDILGACGAWCP